MTTDSLLTYDLETPPIPDGGYVVRANGTWLDLKPEERPFMLSDTQNIKLHYLPLEPLSEALGVSLSKEDGCYFMHHGETFVQAPVVMHNGVPFVSDEFLTRKFYTEGIDITVKMSRTANADTLSVHGASSNQGQILVNLKSDCPILAKGEEAEYLFAAGKYENNGIAFTYRIARHSPNPKESHALVLFQHGGSGRGNDNAKHIDNARMAILDYFARKGQNVVLLLPQATHGSWSFYKFALADLVRQLLETDDSIDRDKVYALGVSAGGAGTWQLVDAAPELFAAAMPVAYYAETEEAHVFNACPYEPIYLCSLENLIKVPLLVIAGSEDINGVATDPKRVQDSYESIVKAGGEASFDCMPGLDHVGVCTGAFTDEHLDWITSHTRALS